jgi:hypothetical protein
MEFVPLRTIRQTRPWRAKMNAAGHICTRINARLFPRDEREIRKIIRRRAINLR